MSILKTRFNRFVHVIEIRFSAGVRSDPSAEWHFVSLPRLAGVTSSRYLLLGANTPWKRVRFIRGFGANETNREIKSNGSNMTCVVPLRQGVFNSYRILPLRISDKRFVDTAGRDAAHASSPNMASGTAMAFEDALVMSNLIVSGREVAQVMSDYTAQRLSRVRWVHEQTHRRDRIRNMPPFVRELLARPLANKIYRANYAPLLEEI